jgi:hypothetical protein
MRHKRGFLLLLLVALGLGAVAITAIPQGSAAASPAAQPAGLYVFSAKFVCGKQGSDDPRQAAVRPGIYATEINIHNYNPTDVSMRKHVIPLLVNGDAIGREPRFAGVRGEDSIVLPPDTATMDDCARLTELLHLPPDAHVIGFLELISTRDLNVEAVYTVEGRAANTDVDVEHIAGKLVSQ